MRILCRTLDAENHQQKLTIRRLEAEAEQLRQGLMEAAKRRGTAGMSVQPAGSALDSEEQAEMAQDNLASPKGAGRVYPGGPGYATHLDDKSDEIGRLLDQEELQFRCPGRRAVGGWVLMVAVAGIWWSRMSLLQGKDRQHSTIWIG